MNSKPPSNPSAFDAFDDLVSLTPIAAAQVQGQGQTKAGGSSATPSRGAESAVSCGQCYAVLLMDLVYAMRAVALYCRVE